MWLVGIVLSLLIFYLPLNDCLIDPNPQSSLLLNSFPPTKIPVKSYHRKSTDPKTPSNPIVFVPGDGGSRLEANLTGKPTVVHYICDKYTKDYYSLWLNLQTMAPVIIDCWADNMRLVFNTTIQRSDHAPGVDVRIPGIGSTEAVEWLNPSHFSQVCTFLILHPSYLFQSCVCSTREEHMCLCFV